MNDHHSAMRLTLFLLIQVFFFFIAGCSNMEKEKAFVKPESGVEIAGGTVEGDVDPEEAGIHLRLSEESRRLAGIMTGVAGLRKMADFIEVPGEIFFNRDKHARLIPRFPGIVKEIMKNIGDNVNKGDVLAQIGRAHV